MELWGSPSISKHLQASLQRILAAGVNSGNAAPPPESTNVEERSFGRNCQEWLETHRNPHRIRMESAWNPHGIRMESAGDLEDLASHRKKCSKFWRISSKISKNWRITARIVKNP